MPHLIQVPYDLRHEAKQRGGKWEPYSKRWSMPTLSAAIDVEEIVRNALQAAKPKQTGQTLRGSLESIAEKFKVARQHLKWPKLMFFNIGPFRNVRITLAPDSGKNAGFLYIKGIDSTAHYLGKIDPKGEFFPIRECPSEVTDFLQEFSADPAGVAARNGKAAGHCCFCSRQLTDDRSLDVGYGPICAGHWNLPWGEKE